MNEVQAVTQFVVIARGSNDSSLSMLSRLTSSNVDVISETNVFGGGGGRPYWYRCMLILEVGEPIGGDAPTNVGGV